MSLMVIGAVAVVALVLLLVLLFGIRRDGGSRD
jgi:hypothetical protein